MNNIDLIPDPLTMKPKEARARNQKAQAPKKKKKEPEITTVVMCGCGNHPINPKKDLYTQHNNWAAQFHRGMESGRTDIRNVKGIGSSAEQIKPTYDFSGDEFEMSDAEMRKFNAK